MIGGQPVAVEKKIVNLVGKNELFDFDALLAKASGEIHGLSEIDVAVVVAVDEKNGRLPSVHRGNRRRVVGELVQIGRDILAVPIVGGPIMNAVEIDASDKEIGVATEAECGEVAAVASAPQADLLGGDIRTTLQKFSGGNDVLIFRRATTGPPRRFTKRTAVANAAAIVERENDVATAREILIHGVGIRVVVHVVPAEKHLANRAAVKKNQRGAFVA